jgi:hypothetical protein
MRKSTRRGFLTRLMSLVAITQSSAGSSQTPARLEARLVDSVEPRGTAGECDFISLHAKGNWSSREEAQLRNAVDAVSETAELALATDPARFRGLQIINNEADMRVGFNIPYQARMDERFAAWLCAR